MRLCGANKMHTRLYLLTKDAQKCINDKEEKPLKTHTIHRTLSAVLAMIMLLMILSGCGKNSSKREPEEPATTTDPVKTTEPAETAKPATSSDLVVPTEPAKPSETETMIERQDGERFEAVIILEGMEETVQYEHIRNESLGFEIDYDYENFDRRSESDRECFVSVYDDANNPENYLELTRSTEDAETVATSISEALSKDYDISREDSFPLDRAGSCIRIDASADVGGLTMPDHLQMVYIIPAADGCRIATAHYYIVGSEGFGRRFAYMMQTFSVID